MTCLNDTLMSTKVPKGNSLHFTAFHGASVAGAQQYTSGERNRALSKPDG